MFYREYDPKEYQEVIGRRISYDITNVSMLNNYSVGNFYCQVEVDHRERHVQRVLWFHKNMVTINDLKYTRNSLTLEEILPYLDQESFDRIIFNLNLFT